MKVQRLCSKYKGSCWGCGEKFPVGTDIVYMPNAVREVNRPPSWRARIHAMVWHYKCAPENLRAEAA